EIGAGKGGVEIVTAKQMVHRCMETTMEGYQAEPGILTGFSRLDAMTGGLRPGRLAIIAGRPATGKTGLALQIALSVSERPVERGGGPVLFFSLEMPQEELYVRAVANLAGVDSMTLQQRQWDSVAYARVISPVNDRLAELPLFISDDCELSVPAMRAAARRLVKEQGIRLILIDHLHHLPLPEGSGRESLHAGYSKLVKGIWQMGRTLNVPVLLLCQLSRNTERREEKRPVLSDLRETGSIEENAHLVLMLYRAGYYQRTEGEPEPVEGDLEVLVRKNRQGPTGSVTLRYRLDQSRYWETDAQAESLGQHAPPDLDEQHWSEER
ncbi:MAG TPA: DnaB-like helicase C-terminal domain-containing protein, partial [Armatimonadota bacterium]|nr:DnaB-like helicase C-terminal domain-containing protein [Armatimonadota bacterium]